ncbi:MAG: hypothetical protein H0W07_00715 [Chloroflexi bacterium]|nr:hypothetical protein [Chloroflexota bacterium]
MTLPTIDIVDFTACMAGAAAIAWLLPSRGRTATVASTVLLGGAVGLAALLQLDGRVLVADRALVWGPFVRWWLLAASGSLLGLHLVGIAAGARAAAAPQSLAALAAMAVALTLDDPLASLLVLTAASLVALGSHPAAAEVRVATITAGLALVGAGIALTVQTPGHALFDLTQVVASALFMGATAVAIRAGAFPVARLSRSIAALPPSVAAGPARSWLPATSLLLLVEVTAGYLGPTGGDLSSTAATIRFAGVAALAVVCIVTLLARDVDRLVGGTVVVNGSLLLFALVPDVLREPALGSRAVAAWLPLFAVTASWAVAWLVALRGTESALAVGIRGWARLRPVLALALVAGGAMSYGWPGSLTWEARAALLDLAIEPGDLRRAAGVLAWLPALGLVRVLFTGLRHGGPLTPATASGARRHSMARRFGLGRILRGPSIASFLVLLLALAPALLARGP